MNDIKNGKKPLSAKTKPQLQYDDLFGNSLVIPEDVKKDIEQSGLVARFIDAQSLYNTGGYHAKGWVPYKRKTDVKMNSAEFSLGKDPEGTIRRGSLILAVKSKEANEQHKEYLRSKTQRQNGFQRQAAAEMRKHAKQSSIDAKIFEGYDENED